jgi:hypothetical protein
MTNYSVEYNFKKNNKIFNPFFTKDNLFLDLKNNYQKEHIKFLPQKNKDILNSLFSQFN